MTIEEYLGKSSAELAAMTDKELEKHFKNILVFTRPELVVKETKTATRRSVAGANIKSQRTLDILGQLSSFGVDIDEL